MVLESYEIYGVVQGVGFRPFVSKLAAQLALCGFVQNCKEKVRIEVQGSVEQLALFEQKLFTQLPLLAKIEHYTKTKKPLQNYKSFEIKASQTNKIDTYIPTITPDSAPCAKCYADLQTKGRFFHYFATSCCDCGPRYTITYASPFDRQNTTMNSFAFCDACEAAYNDPTDRRYHAQTFGCKECGPKLQLFDHAQKLLQTKDPLAFVAKTILQGSIVAIKGVGGFHLVCDATNSQAIQKLRKAKKREKKPFAVICKESSQIDSFALWSDFEKELVQSRQNPIVLLRKSASFALADELAPDIDRIGCMLPPSLLHSLLLQKLENPIVATSANLGSEPIITHYEKIYERLDCVDYVLSYNREIVAGLDDSVVQAIDGKMQILRLARGYSPLELTSPLPFQTPTLALGAESKNSFALAKANTMILSASLGDMQNRDSFAHFLSTMEHLKQLYAIDNIGLLLGDKHPSYKTTQWANEQELPFVQIGHHLAHLYAIKAEYQLQGEYLGFSFDGSGYGEDATLWGGEVFVGDVRKYHFKPLKLLGGAQAIKEPRRIALSLLFEYCTLEQLYDFDLELLKQFSPVELQILYKSYTQDLNAPKTSSAGRLFDAIASFANLVHKLSYEGQSGLLCESYFDPNRGERISYTLEDGVIDLKIAEYILCNKPDKTELISAFFHTLADLIVALAKKEKKELLLGGGVFQNNTLLTLVTQALKKENIPCYFQTKTPCNDGSIALGQLYYSLI